MLMTQQKYNVIHSHMHVYAANCYGKYYDIISQ